MPGHPTWGTLQGQAGCPPRRVHGHPVGTAAPTTTLSCPWRGADTSSTPRCVVNTQVLQCNERGGGTHKQTPQRDAGQAEGDTVRLAHTCTHTRTYTHAHTDTARHRVMHKHRRFQTTAGPARTRTARSSTGGGTREHTCTGCATPGGARAHARTRPGPARPGGRCRRSPARPAPGAACPRPCPGAGTGGGAAGTHPAAAERARCWRCRAPAAARGGAGRLRTGAGTAGSARAARRAGRGSARHGTARGGVARH